MPVSDYCQCGGFGGDDMGDVQSSHAGAHGGTVVPREPRSRVPLSQRACGVVSSCRLVVECWTDCDD